MFSAFSVRRASSRSLASALKGFAVAATLCATALFAAPREAHALFENEAFQASYDAYLASWAAWQSDGGGVEGNYHYWATVYSYYGYAYAAYGDWYDYDPYFEYAIVYHDGAGDLWEALVFYGVGGADSANAAAQSNSASTVCWWASFF
jgi:hypothetical protein